LEDLEATGKLGYVEGVSRIINKNLNELDQTKRPIHCSDMKREVLYIKNDDQWIKENEHNKPILTKAIKQIANENIKKISEWRNKHPDCVDPESKNNDEYLNIVSNAMSGSTAEEQLKNYEKIITKVAKEVLIEK
jgi:pyruvate/2-oxoacid:ferredoxin oxidoreductase alpha subunit